MVLTTTTHSNNYCNNNHTTEKLILPPPQIKASPIEATLYIPDVTILFYVQSLVTLLPLPINY